MRSRAGGPRTELLLHFPQLLLLLTIAQGVFTAGFGIWTATSVWSFPQFILAVAVMLLSLPSSLQFFWKLSSQQATALTSSELELVENMGGHCTDGQVVQARQRIAQYLVAMTPCRALVSGMYPGYFVSRSELAERRADDRQFWREWNEGTIRTDTLVRYKTDYVVIDAREGDALTAGQAAAVRDGPIPLAPVTLVPFYDNADFVVYWVMRGDESGP